MRILVFSDVHANLQALEAVFEDANDKGTDGAVCLGDVVGYGGDPNACCDLVRERTTVTLIGNHDAAVIGAMDTGFYYPAAQHALFWTRRELTESNFRWLYSLPYTHRMNGAAFYHSAPILPSGFYYVVRREDARAHSRMLERLQPFNFIGHSHLTHSYVVTAKGAKDLGDRESLTSPEDGKYIINVGSVGQPRDRDPRACYGIYDTKEQTFEHFRVEYDIEAAANRIREVGLEDRFADRLFSGS